MRRRLLLVLTWLMTGTICFGADPAPALSPDEASANRALGHRIAQQAQISLGTGAITPASLRYSAALLEVAAQLDPAESRHLRLLTEAYLQIGGDEGRDGAIKSLSRYLKLEPADMGSMLRMIRLYFSQMDAADAQRKYIEDMLATTVLAPELRAEVAVMGAKLALDRVEVEQSKKYIDQALELFPLCPEALRLKYELMDQTTPAIERLAVLLQMLRANPAQPYVMAAIADQLAAAGLVDPAQTWYMQCLKLANRMGASPDPEHVTAYAAELVIADQHRSAEPWIRGLVEADPTNSDAAFLDLLIARRTKQPERIEPATATVQKALETRLSRIADVLHERQEPGSFDLAADVAKLQSAARLDLTSAYAASLADLAWLKIHFQNRPADAQPYLEPLKQLLMPDSITLARLEGWAFLVEGKNDEARVKLSAVSARDPLSALGLIKIDSADQPADQIHAQARALVSTNAAGLLGAMLIESLRDKVGLMPPGPDATTLKAELDKFNMRWLDILDIREAKDFYLLKAEPVKITHTFGEPIMARVTIINLGPFDITIGPEGTIKPDLWVDVRLTRPEQGTMPGIAFDRMTAKLVIRPNESVSQVMRVDAGPLVTVLSRSPTLDVPLYYALLTNPTTIQGIVPGPGGYRVQFQRVPVRSASRLDENAMITLNGLLQSGEGDVRVRTLDLLGTYSLLLRSVDNAEARDKAVEFADIVRKGTGDAVPAVRAQAMLVTAFLADPEVRAGVLQQMLSDPAFSARVLGVAAVAAMPDLAEHRALIKPMAESDPDPLIRALAASAVEVAETAPATQPAPGTGETPQPGVPEFPPSEFPAPPISLPSGTDTPPSPPRPGETPAPGGGGLRL